MVDNVIRGCEAEPHNHRKHRAHPAAQLKRIHSNGSRSQVNEVQRIDRDMAGLLREIRKFEKSSRVQRAPEDTLKLVALREDLMNLREARLRIMGPRFMEGKAFLHNLWYWLPPLILDLQVGRPQMSSKCDRTSGLDSGN